MRAIRLWTPAVAGLWLLGCAGGGDSSAGGADATGMLGHDGGPSPADATGAFADARAPADAAPGSDGSADGSSADTGFVDGGIGCRSASDCANIPRGPDGLSYYCRPPDR